MGSSYFMALLFVPRCIVQYASAKKNMNPIYGDLRMHFLLSLCRITRRWKGRLRRSRGHAKIWRRSSGGSWRAWMTPRGMRPTCETASKHACQGRCALFLRSRACLNCFKTFLKHKRHLQSVHELEKDNSRHMFSSCLQSFHWMPSGAPYILYVLTHNDIMDQCEPLPCHFTPFSVLCYLIFMTCWVIWLVV